MLLTLREQVRQFTMSVQVTYTACSEGFTMSISYVDNPSGQPLTLWTSDSEGLRDLLEEYRRCKAVSELKGEGQDFSWLAAYAGRSSRPAICTSKAYMPKHTQN